MLSSLGIKVEKKCCG